MCIFQVKGVLHIAGQIGLIPGSMELSDTIESQAKLGLRHLKRILQVYCMTLRNIVQVIEGDLLMTRTTRSKLTFQMHFRNGNSSKVFSHSSSSRERPQIFQKLGFISP